MQSLITVPNINCLLFSFEFQVTVFEVCSKIKHSLTLLPLHLFEGFYVNIKSKRYILIVPNVPYQILLASIHYSDYSVIPVAAVISEYITCTTAYAMLTNQMLLTACTWPYIIAFAESNICRSVILVRFKTTIMSFLFNDL